MNYITGRPPSVSGGRCWLKSEQRSFVITGLPVRPSHKFGFRSSVSKNGLPGEGRHEGLVPRNDVLTNGFIWFSLARTLARILFVPRLRSPWKTHKALRTWRRLLERVVQILKSAIKQAHLTNADEDTVSRHPSPTTPHQPSTTRHLPPVTHHPWKSPAVIFETHVFGGTIRYPSKLLVVWAIFLLLAQVKRTTFIHFH